MPDAPLELDALVDLKMLPAWVNEPPPGERYAQHEGGDREERRGRDRRDRRGKRPTRSRDAGQRPPPGEQRRDRPPRDRFRGKKRDDRQPGDRRGKDRHRGPIHREPRPEKSLPKIEVKFLPRSAAVENVVAQIKSGAVAYSLFALARLFLEKPARYEVKLNAPAESPMFQLGEHGAVSSDHEFLDRSAFRFTKSDFYKIDISETEPIKGNFTNVARCRLSGTVFGPTNHHDYQRRLRNLYEQRFSRRMSFPEYQHKIEIVSDPAVIEKWKEDARKQTTFTTQREDPPQTFSSETDAEKHFRQRYLDGLIQNVAEVTIATAQIADRDLRRVVEEAWNRETKSPSQMMQELAGRFRENGLHIFRHRRGMLFISPIYPRPLPQDQETSPQVRAIFETISAQPRIGRKELADKLIASLAGEEAEKAKLALASDLKWLIDGGHVIEFNDGSLDLPRAKTKPKQKEESSVVANASSARTAPAASESVEAPDEQHAEVGAIDPIARGRFGEPPLPENETEIGGS